MHFREFGPIGDAIDQKVEQYLIWCIAHKWLGLASLLFNAILILSVAVSVLAILTSDTFHLNITVSIIISVVFCFLVFAIIHLLHMRKAPRQNNTEEGER